MNLLCDMALTSLEQQEEIDFWRDKENHRQPTIKEYRAKHGKDPIISWRCGDNIVIAEQGYALSPVQMRFIELFRSKAK